MARDSIPAACEGFEDCEMFACMVESCWCKESPPEGGIVFRAGNQVTNEEDAQQAVISHLGSTPGKIYAKKLNALFYNVFYEQEAGNEKVLSVAADGTVMETICGV